MKSQFISSKEELYTITNAFRTELETGYNFKVADSKLPRFTNHVARALGFENGTRAVPEHPRIQSNNYASLYNKMHHRPVAHINLVPFSYHARRLLGALPIMLFINNAIPFVAGRFGNYHEHKLGWFSQNSKDVNAGDILTSLEHPIFLYDTQIGSSGIKEIATYINGAIIALCQLFSDDIANTCHELGIKTTPLPQRSFIQLLPSKHSQNQPYPLIDFSTITINNKSINIHQPDGNALILYSDSGYLGFDWKGILIDGFRLYAPSHTTLQQLKNVKLKSVRLQRDHIEIVKENDTRIPSHELAYPLVLSQP